MKTAPIQRPQPGTAQLDDAAKAKLQKSARDFEAIFVGMMLKSMRDNQQSTGMFGDSFGGDIVSGMFDSELAKHISQNRGLGLAEMLYHQMTGEHLADAPRHLPHPAVGPASASGSAQPSKGLTRRLQPFETMIRDSSDRHGVDANLVRAVIAAESSAQPDALSPKNAKGLMQLMDATADELGVPDVWNPQDNIEGGTAYLRQLLDQQNGDVRRALASYNAGPSAVAKYDGIPPYPETQQYVERTMRFLKLFQSRESVNDTNDQ